MPTYYDVQWRVTPDDDALPEREGLESVLCASMQLAMNVVADDMVSWDHDAEKITLLAWPTRQRARGQLPPLPSPRTQDSSPPSSP